MLATRALSSSTTPNLGSGVGYSLLAVVDMCRAVTGHEIPTRFASWRVGDPPKRVADSEAIRDRLGLQQIVESAWDWHRRHPKGYWTRGFSGTAPFHHHWPSSSMELNFASGALLAFGGLVAGFLNTVAGGGSTITIPLLVEFLGDPRVANGTNRIAILLQNVVGVASFQRGGVLPWKVVAPLIAPVIIGGAGGAYLATHISAEVIRTVLSVVIVAVALSVVMAPRRWQEGGAAKLGLAARIGIFAVIGFYGGLVQAGVGLPLLIGLVLGCGLNLVSANAVKVTLVLGMTAVALPVFVYSGQVAWVPGLILASGNMSGAWIASHLAIRKGAGWIRWVVLVAAIAGALRMLVFR